MSVAWPEPTREELDRLTFHVTQWGSRTTEQQAICLAILRGHCRVAEIAKYLQLGRKNVEREIVGLMGNGLRRDGERLMLQ